MGSELEKMFNKTLQALSDKDENLAKSIINDDEILVIQKPQLYLKYKCLLPKDSL